MPPAPKSAKLKSSNAPSEQNPEHDSKNPLLPENAAAEETCNYEEYFGDALAKALDSKGSKLSPDQKKELLKQWEAPIMRELTVKVAAEDKVRKVWSRVTPDRYAYEAAIIHRIGEVSNTPCAHCSLEHSNPPFSECVTLEGYFFGGCTNCHFNHDNTNCTFRSNGFPRAPGLCRGNKADSAKLKNHLWKKICEVRCKYFADEILRRVLSVLAQEHADFIRALIPHRDDELEFKRYGEFAQLVQEVQRLLQDAHATPMREKFYDLIKSEEGKRLMNCVVEERKETLKQLLIHPAYIFINNPTRETVKVEVLVFFNRRYTIAVADILHLPLGNFENKGKYLCLIDGKKNLALEHTKIQAKNLEIYNLCFGAAESEEAARLSGDDNLKLEQDEEMTEYGEEKEESVDGDEIKEESDESAYMEED